MNKNIKRYAKLKRLLTVLLILVLAFLAYVEIVNTNSKNMTYRQKFLKAVYPALMWFTKRTQKNVTALTGTKQPPVSFYNQKATLINGDTLDFTSLAGKKVLLVNTASNCGYTNQYNDLQKLQEIYKDKLVVLGFPANDFKEQEKGADSEIAEFCKVNFGVSFPLLQKSVVVQSPQQNPVFQWLTDSTKNGWNNKFPSWNFSKYLVDEKGILNNYFDPSVSPLSEAVIKAIE
jgi:glutathione peroxidase